MKLHLGVYHETVWYLGGKERLHSVCILPRPLKSCFRLELQLVYHHFILKLFDPTITACERGGLTPPIINLGTLWRRFTYRSLYPGESAISIHRTIVVGVTCSICWRLNTVCCHKHLEDFVSLLVSCHFRKVNTKEDIWSCQYWQYMENTKQHGDW